jgi:hypothetical protein
VFCNPAKNDVVRVKLELGKAFHVWTDPASDAGRMLAATVTFAIQAFLDEFGIAGRVVVDQEILPPDEELRVNVNGKPFPYSEQQVRTLWEYHDPSGLGYVRVPCSLEDYIRERSAPGRPIEDAPGVGSPIGFLAQLIVEVVKQHPEELFAATQAGL